MPSSGFNDIELNYGRLTPASEGVVKAETNGDVYFVVLARHFLSFVSMFVDINLHIARKDLFPGIFLANTITEKSGDSLVARDARKSSRWKIL